MREREIRPTAQIQTSDWTTMERDISLAHDVLARYHDLDDGPSSIYLQEATVYLEGSVQVRQADWVIELQEKYESQYGEEKGEEILCRVLSAFITFGNTVH